MSQSERVTLLFSENTRQLYSENVPYTVQSIESTSSSQCSFSISQDTSAKVAFDNEHDYFTNETNVSAPICDPLMETSLQNDAACVLSSGVNP